MYGKAGRCHSRCWLVGKESRCKSGLGSASQVALPASAGDIRDVGLIPGSGRSPGGGHGSPLQYSCLENPWKEEPGGLSSMQSQRVRHD